MFVLWDGFETIVSPRRVTRKVRLTRLFYRFTWISWSRIVNRLTSRSRRETLFSVYGPLSLIFLMTIWAGSLIFGFGILHWACGSVSGPGDGVQRFIGDLYFSGTTFFTLGLGDVAARTISGRVLTVIEAGLGFGFLAMIISHLPALNQSFGLRETSISMLDARAGSPPTAAEILRRHSHGRGVEDLRELLLNWERWSAELLETHLSYPVLAYFRSQHENQSWLSSLSAILDVSAVLIASRERNCETKARLTFAMARHTVVDLAIVFNLPPEKALQERLLPEDLAILEEVLAAKPFQRENDGPIDGTLLKELRDMYEPYVYSLADYFCLVVPKWSPSPGRKDNWQTSVWQKIVSPGEQKRHHF
jgi:hypothetical protein